MQERTESGDPMLFYFTGTGNSLYAAKQIEAHPVSIPQIIHLDALEFTAGQIGIVAPVYGHEVPPMVKDFLKRGVFHTCLLYTSPRAWESSSRVGFRASSLLLYSSN